MAPDTVYARWRDLLHEMPEAESALRAYIERKADRRTGAGDSGRSGGMRPDPRRTAVRDSQAGATAATRPRR